MHPVAFGRKRKLRFLDCRSPNGTVIKLQMNAPRPIKGSLPALDEASEKERILRGMMHEMGTVLVAYSGGVDSAYLALIATQELGEKAICVLGLSPSVSAHQRSEAESTAKAFDFNLQTIETAETDDPNYAANPTDRCYFCKSELYGKLRNLAASLQFAYVVDGTNADDLGDLRPGRIAAGENQVKSALADAGFSKKEIRERSRFHGLPTWDKPASPCLSSRIAYGVPVTIERLGKVERAEAFLRSEGFREFRVRVHGELARIEIAKDEMGKALTQASSEKFAAALRKIGFRYITLDLEGFRSGAMNEAAADIDNENKEEQLEK
jgi:pyridinium-3,5-biscarboxylic acid mononucleotide sulfurtransferase